MESSVKVELGKVEVAEKKEREEAKGKARQVRFVFLFLFLFLGCSLSHSLLNAFLSSDQYPIYPFESSGRPTIIKFDRPSS